MLDNDNIKQQIISKATNYKKDILFNRFIDSFFSYIPIDDKKSFDVAEFCDIAIFMYKEFLNRKVGKHKITIHTEKVGNATVISIINDDMPFIVDSITELLNRKQYKIEHMINSLFCTMRDSQGTAVDIKGSNNIPNESIIYVKISALKNEESLSKINSDISKILSHVRIAVSDWKAMMVKLDDATNWLSNEEPQSENRAFLNWILDDNFTFTGYQEFEGSNLHNIKDIVGSELGINKLEKRELNDSIIEDVFKSNSLSVIKPGILIGKIREVSKVHRYSSLDYICILNGNKNKIQAKVFLGLFASRLDYQSATVIPIIRKKVEDVLIKANFDRNSFNGKELFSIIETLPRDELFQLTEDELFLMSMVILSSLNNPRLLFFVRENKCKVYLNLLVFFPRLRITPDIIEKVHSVIQKNIPGKFIRSILRFSSLGLAYVHISMKVSDNKDLNINIPQMERELDIATVRWNEKLDVFLEDKFGSEMASKFLKIYSKAFPANYCLQYSLRNAVYDIECIEQLSDQRKFFFSLYKRSADARNSFKLKIYSLEEKIALHKIMPIIDNLGFSAIDESVFKITPNKFDKSVWIQDFTVYVDDKEAYEITNIKQNIVDAIVAIFMKKAKNDPLNALILKGGITWREVFLLNAYCKYLLQIKFEYSQEMVKFTLVNNPVLVKLIIHQFYLVFDPNSQDQSELRYVANKIKLHLSHIANSTEYRIMEKFVELVNNTLRTNYFQKDKDAFKEYISFKFNSQNISNLPLPKPHVEIFVYSMRVEGIHLRAGEIARGGLRWSDRMEDYRTEVLGLMKAQMTKNTIIVPEGSKGGFFVKNPEKLIGKDYFNEGVECYKIFLRGMLDITDNVVNNKVIKPKNTVCLDEDDPYLVVAADKGTATFSDIANQISSQEYNFWLGDAFASGGQVGYDHKKMAITARGAWISVIEHLGSLNIDPSKDEFTAIGIGDMSGDVFGNGMLCSNKIKLLAAFNHVHIFIDPKPNAQASYKERKRLFDLPRSTWEDYDRKLISAGGGVFDRQAKFIKLSKEAKLLLDIKEDQIDPDSLIRHILMMKVDLLWNGGIGTYVKSETEVNEQIGNKDNDRVRINGKDLRSRAVAEGGNLGFTQLGRIEYAMNGGLINTDFIDNSGGVDCSDHEVNIKIALNSLVSKNKLSKENRDKLLADMQDEVAELVLKDNKIQNQNISISLAYQQEFFESYVRLIDILKEKVELNSELEFLPNKAELARRHNENTGFTRPELAILMAYSKRAAYKELLNSALAKDPYYDDILLNYFPVQMQQKFKTCILQHKLNSEIITTVIANDLINRCGDFFFHLAQSYTGMSGYDIAKAYTTVWALFKLEELEQAIFEVSKKEVRIELFYSLRSFLQKAIEWFLRNESKNLDDISALINRFTKDIDNIKSKILTYGTLKGQYKTKISNLLSKGVSSAVASNIAVLDALYSSMDIISIANATKGSIESIAKIYFQVGEKLYYDWLQEKVDSISQSDYWNNILNKSLKDDICHQQKALIIKIAKIPGDSFESKLEKWTIKYSKQIQRLDEFMESIKSLDNIDYAKLVVAIKQINILM